MPASSTETLNCWVCGDQFSRPDHLSRHQRSHNVEKPFSCKTCEKPFTRRDTLARHEKGHESNKNGRHRTIFNRVDRACINCSRSKIRCDSGQPCKPCASKDLNCMRASRRRKRRTTRRSFASAEDSPTDQLEDLEATNELSSRLAMSAVSPGSNTNETDTSPRSLAPPSTKPSSVTPTTISAEDWWPFGNYMNSANDQQMAQPSAAQPAYGNIASSNYQWFQPQFGLVDWMPWNIEELLTPIESSLMDFYPTTNELTQSEILDDHAQGPKSASACLRDANDRAGILSTHSGSICSVDEVLETKFTCGDLPEPHSMQKQTSMEQNNATFTFPESQTTDFEVFQVENFGHVEQLQNVDYNRIVTGVGHSCNRLFSQDLTRTNNFPSIQALNSFIQLYFEHFQSLFPVIHQPTFSPPDTHWIELLAISAIGSRYSKSSISARCSYTFTDILRMSISHAKDRSCLRTLWLTRAMMLNEISMVYSGDRRFLEMGLATGNAVTTQCRRNNFLRANILKPEVLIASDPAQVDDLWLSWICNESCSRLGYGSWILQCQLPLHFDLPSSMSMAELKRPLPCTDALWEAMDAKTWYSLYRKAKEETLNRSLTIHSVFSDLIMNRPILHLIGDFGRLALIYAIHQTTFDLRSCLANPLLQQDSAFLDTEFPRWQRRASTLLRAIIAKADIERDLCLIQPRSTTWGLAINNVLTTAYHVSLLNVAPVRDLLVLIAPSAREDERALAKTSLTNWASRDGGREARQASLYASLIFTGIRRSPCRSFHEPVALLVSALVLWAHSQLTLSPIPSSGASSVPQATARLDQMWTEEKQNIWVNGTPNTMRGYLMDVGCIDNPSAGKRILEVACKSLLSMPEWSLSSGFAKFLASVKEKGPPLLSAA